MYFYIIKLNFIRVNVSRRIRFCKRLRKNLVTIAEKLRRMTLENRSKHLSSEKQILREYCFRSMTSVRKPVDQCWQIKLENSYHNK